MNEELALLQSNSIIEPFLGSVGKWLRRLPLKEKTRVQFSAELLVYIVFSFKNGEANE